VIGASRRDEFERTFVGDDTRQVLQDAPSAVAVAPTGYATRLPSLDTIGVGYDDSPASEQALTVASALPQSVRGARAWLQDLADLGSIQPYTEKTLAPGSWPPLSIRLGKPTEKRRCAGPGALHVESRAGHATKPSKRGGESDRETGFGAERRPTAPLTACAEIASHPPQRLSKLGLGPLCEPPSVLRMQSSNANCLSMEEALKVARDVGRTHGHVRPTSSRVPESLFARL
jgi:hypothetical protein